MPAAQRRATIPRLRSVLAAPCCCRIGTLSPTDRDHLVGNIVWHLSQGVERSIQERAVKSYFSLVDSDLGARVAKGLDLEVKPKSTAAD